MSKIKLIVEVDKELYDEIKGKDVHYSKSLQAIANGKSYDDTGDFISREALKATIIDPLNVNDSGKNDWYEGYYTAKNEDVMAINNAQAVEPRTEYGTDGQPYKLSMTNGKEYERPQGECKTCIHHDPEDKKCDCGALERQGCQFPVSDDYFCKFYKRGGAE